MDKSIVEEYIKTGHPVWYMGTWSNMPTKARIVAIQNDPDVGEYAHVDCIFDEESDTVGSHDIMFEGLFPSKEALMEDAAKKEQIEIDEIKDTIQTMEDCIRFMFTHTVSCAEEYTNWTARRAIQEVAKERWGIELK